MSDARLPDRAPRSRARVWHHQEMIVRSLSLSAVLLVTTADAAPRAPTPSPCPPADLFSTRLPAVEAGALMFCDPVARDCWRLDATASTWSKAPLAAGREVTVSATGIEACAAAHADCVQLPTTAFEGGQAIESDDRALIAAWRGPVAEIYDARTRKRLTTIKGWKSPMGSAAEAQISQVRFVGTRVVVWESYTPVSSTARLFDARTGKARGMMVSKDTELEPWIAQLAGDVWAVPGFDGRLYLVDTRTGKAKQKLTVRSTPGGSVLAGKLADGRLAIVADGLVFVDPATGKVSPELAQPTCK